MTANVGRSPLGMAVAAAAAIVAAACGSSIPTSSTEPVFSGTGRDLSLSSASGLASVEEDFDCRDVETVRVRFGSPGYVEYDQVRLYLFFDDWQVTW